jgi:hypothetical protein
MYFGFNILSDISKTENNLYLRYCENENAKFYEYVTVYNSNEKRWLYSRNQSFKLKMNIEQ